MALRAVAGRVTPGGGAPSAGNDGDLQLSDGAVGFTAFPKRDFDLSGPREVDPFEWGGSVAERVGASDTEPKWLEESYHNATTNDGYGAWSDHLTYRGTIDAKTAPVVGDVLKQRNTWAWSPDLNAWKWASTEYVEIVAMGGAGNAYPQTQIVWQTLREDLFHDALLGCIGAYPAWWLRGYTGAENAFEYGGFVLGGAGALSMRLDPAATTPAGTSFEAERLVGGLIPPTEDPHVAGMLWNNAGVPAISAG